MDPVISGAGLLAAGAWFTSKILGPSVDSLGDQLKIYGDYILCKHE